MDEQCKVPGCTERALRHGRCFLRYCEGYSDAMDDLEDRHRKLREAMEHVAEWYTTGDLLACSECGSVPSECMKPSDIINFNCPIGVIRRALEDDKEEK